MYKKILLPIIISLTLFVAACRTDSTPLVSNSSPFPASDVPTKAEPEKLNPTNPTELKTAPNAQKESFDLQFLDTMAAHHGTSIFMSELASTKASRADVKDFAQKMIANQTEEVTEIKKMRESWFAGKASALNLKMPGMAESMKAMNMKALNSAEGENFDLEYIKQMIAHHDGALAMAKEASTKAEHEELKSFAKSIIAEQEAEVNRLREWQPAQGGK